MTPSECVFEAIRGRLGGMTLDAFRRALWDWDFIPIEQSGLMVGAVMRKGNEMHIALVPEARNMVYLRGIIRRELNPVIDDFGFVKTSVAKDHEIGHRLAKILGFKVTHEDANCVHYECVGKI